MVDGIGNTTGSIKDLPVYQQYYQLYLEYNKERGTNISFDAWLQRTNYRQYFLQQVENYIETGSVNGGDGINGNTLNGSKYLNNGNTSLYQSQDEETYYDFDFDNGTYTVYHGNESIADIIGIGAEDYDVISFGYKTAEVTNYTFGNLGDGQDTSTSSLTQGRYGGVSYAQKEFDIDYIMNALLMNPNDPQYQIATAIFDELVANMHQWCSAEDLAELDSVAARSGVNSTEYKDKLKEIILKNLDQANEWVEGHSHVEFTNEASMNVSANTEENVEQAKVEYDKDILIESAGLSREYYDGSWSGSNHWDDDTSYDSALSDAKGHAEAVLNSLIAQLQAQIGSAWTQDMTKYVIKLKNSLVQDQKYVYARHDSHGWFKDDSDNGVVLTQALTNEFLKRFDEMCRNGGKTDAEAQAEKEAKKADYKSFYNMDMNSVASSNGIKDVTVVPTGTNQYAEIQTKAENSIITPLKEQIKAKLQGKNIPESEISEILDTAATAALANPQDWATTDNNYTYTIDADKLIDIYEELIKQGIKSKGYEF